MNMPETTEETTQETTQEIAPAAENDPRHLRLLEAILFASAEPVTERVMANRLPEEADVGSLLEELSRTYADRGVNLVRAGNSWAFRTAPDLSQMLNMEIDVPRKMSRAAVETLAIIAYHQPVTRAEIEEVRGVSLSRGTLDVLLEAGWIKPKGRRRTPGRPATWGTTDGFLDHFGIEDVGDLPGMDELKAAGLLESGPAISVYHETAEGDPEKQKESANTHPAGVALGGPEQLREDEQPPEQSLPEDRQYRVSEDEASRQIEERGGDLFCHPPAAIRDKSLFPFGHESGAIRRHSAHLCINLLDPLGRKRRLAESESFNTVLNHGFPHRYPLECLKSPR